MDFQNEWQILKDTLRDAWDSASGNYRLRERNLRENTPTRDLVRAGIVAIGSEAIEIAVTGSISPIAPLGMGAAFLACEAGLNQIYSRVMCWLDDKDNKPGKSAPPSSAPS